MSSLTHSEKLYFEKLFGMYSGYVLEFTDAKFGEFFREFGINIHGSKYHTYGTSKAKKLRAFWESEPDELVGTVLAEMLNVYESSFTLHGRDFDSSLVGRAREFADRLVGESLVSDARREEIEFLGRELIVPRIHKLPVGADIGEIIAARFTEAHVALDAGAYLSVIFMCGSILEAVLLGAAEKAPDRFQQAERAPRTRKGKGRPKDLGTWRLAQLIDVACEVGLLDHDTRLFSHGLRDFRNYIHPKKQLDMGFTPDEHTARLCLQALNAGLASLAGERQ